MIVTSHVVLLARVDDPELCVTVATYSTLVSVLHEPHDTPAQVAECAFEIAPDMKDWTRT